MFGRQGLAGFQFKDEAAFYKQVSKVVAKNRTVLISHLQGSLSLDSQADFSQTVGRPVFLTLLEMPVAKISMQVEGGLPDLITQSPHALVVSHGSALFVFLCLLWPFPAKIPLPHFANASESK